ncbi:Killer cell lectin-like receptor subfamily B member 1A [Trichoplax sp. H2]|nr:Killer cell lectin-like receptor subfamily B member 1A [Trichoplax sp. H2]|eukprot:RDD38989.1 Killer cell lectin-like receptor subfamily B member 1A [Trichoplax sp. H2]
MILRCHFIASSQIHTCPDNWLMHQDNLRTDCFKLFNGSHLEWNEANNSCITENGTLLLLLDSSMAQIVQRLYKNYGSLAWIGMQATQGDSGKYYEYKWINGQKFDLASPGWSRLPELAKGAQKCVSLFLSHWQLLTESCDSKLNYLCHRASITTLPYATSTQGPNTAAITTDSTEVNGAAGLSLYTLLSIGLALFTMGLLGIH